MKIWNKISHIGVKTNDSVQEIRLKKLNNQVGLFTTLVTFFFIPYLFIIGNFHFLPLQVLTVLLIALYFPFNHYGYFKLSMFWRFFILAADIVYSSLEMPNGGFEYFLIPLGLVPFILSNVKTTQFSLFFSSILIFFITLILSRHYTPHVIISAQTTTITHALVLSMVFLLCGLFIFKFKAASLTYENVIHAQLKLIEQKNRDILDSITYAKRIQKALLPPTDELHRTIKDYFVYYKPKDIVSGDFYWLEKHSGKTFIAVADCTGHGVPGAIMSVLCINILTRVVKEMGIIQPSLILDKVAELMDDRFSKTGMHVMDGMDIGLCCIDLNNDSIEFAAANNPMYIISSGNLTELKADKQPIGKMDNRKLYTNHKIKLNKGDCYYLLSDGFSDQFGGTREKKYTSKKLKDTLLSNHLKPKLEQKNLLNESFEAWRGNLPQVDDICVLGFRV